MFDVDNTRCFVEKLLFCDFGVVIDLLLVDVIVYVVELLGYVGQVDIEVCCCGIDWLLIV